MSRKNRNIGVIAQLELLKGSAGPVQSAQGSSGTTSNTEPAFSDPILRSAMIVADFTTKRTANYTADEMTTALKQGRRKYRVLYRGTLPDEHGTFSPASVIKYRRADGSTHTLICPHELPPKGLASLADESQRIVNNLIDIDVFIKKPSSHLKPYYSIYYSLIQIIVRLAELRFTDIDYSAETLYRPDGTTLAHTVTVSGVSPFPDQDERSLTIDLKSGFIAPLQHVIALRALFFGTTEEAEAL